MQQLFFEIPRYHINTYESKRCKKSRKQNKILMDFADASAYMKKKHKPRVNFEYSPTDLQATTMRISLIILKTLREA